MQESFFSSQMRKETPTVIINSERFTENENQVKQTFEFSLESIQQMSIEDIQFLLEQAPIHEKEPVQQINKLNLNLELLSRSRDILIEMLNNSPIGCLVLTENDIILQANLTAGELLGVKPGELIAMQFMDFIVPEDKAAFREKQKEIGKSCHKQTCELQLKRRNGTVFPARLECLLSLDSQGRLEWLTTIMFNSTVKKNAELALVEIGEFNTNLLENSPDAIIVHNLDTSILYVNSAMEKLTGFNRKEVINRKAPYPWWPKDIAPRLTRKLHDVRFQDINKTEYGFRNKRGEEFWVEISAAPLNIHGQVKYLISNMVDVTERKRLREGTELYAREITRIQEEERKRIARELHDDTAQSLAYLAMELDSLINNAEITSEKVIQRLKHLKQQTNDSLQEVRRFSHELRPGVLDQLGLIAAIELLVDELNSRNQLSMGFSVLGQERRLSNEEEQALFRMTQEALSNIRKHSQATKAEVIIQFSRNKVKLTILDNGKGFQPSEIDDAVAKGRLGLIGMKERANLIGATLSLKSAPNHGVRIAINLDSKAKSKNN